MAIAFDATTTGNKGSAGSSLTYSHTCTGSNLVLLVGVESRNNDVTGVTYATVAMTQIGSAQVSADGLTTNTVWQLAAPATGANNVVVSITGTNHIASVASSYTGVDQTTPVATNASGTGTTQPTVNVSATSTTQLVVDFAGTRTNGSDATTAGASQTERGDVLATSGDPNQQCFSSDEPGINGTVTMDWTIANNRSWCSHAVVLNAAKAAGGGGPLVKSLMFGLVLA